MFHLLLILARLGNQSKYTSDVDGSIQVVTLRVETQQTQRESDPRSSHGSYPHQNPHLQPHPP